MHIQDKTNVRGRDVWQSSGAEDEVEDFEEALQIFLSFIKAYPERSFILVEGTEVLCEYEPYKRINHWLDKKGILL